MLEALGVETAFITIPGHIYAAFDTGMESGQKDGAFNSRQDDLIAHNGRLWMPVEITVTGEGFYRAWRIGAREWGQSAERIASEFSQSENSTMRAIYPMRESWALYPPVTVPEAGDRLPELPEERDIVNIVMAFFNRF
jgi:hypothetical protein